MTSILLNESHDFLKLCINTVRNDLISRVEAFQVFFRFSFFVLFVFFFYPSSSSAPTPCATQDRVDRCKEIQNKPRGSLALTLVGNVGGSPESQSDRSEKKQKKATKKPNKKTYGSVWRSRWWATWAEQSSPRRCTPTWRGCSSGKTMFFF